MQNEIHKTGNEQVVEVFSLAAILILFLAIFNYVNLTTARSVNRAREVGVKKTLGASRKVLVRQFLTESFLLVFLSGAIAFTIVRVSLPWFSSVFGVQMQVTTLLSAEFILLFISGNILVGLLAGFYPSFVLSSYQPANVIRGKLLLSHRGIWLRRILVVAQFTIAVALIAGTALVYNQLQYINKKELGFQKENTLVININFLDFAGKAKVLKESLLEKSSVKDVTFISSIIGTNDRIYAYPIDYEGNKEGQDLELNIIAADVRTDDFFNLEMVEGRFFSDDFPADITGGVVINESAARLIGWDEPLNRNLTIKYLNQGQHHQGRVIGVAKDFHMKSLHHEIEPLAMVAVSDPATSYFYNLMLVKTHHGNSPSEIMNATAEIWGNLKSGKPLEAYFLDDRINQLYEQEKRTARMFSVFAIISVLISCLGLYGMSAYTAEIRKKEVCIRKIMGASVAGIVGKLSQSYLLLICLAGALGSFIAWSFGVNWLQGFAYKADMGIWIYLLSIAFVLVISVFTMISEILKIARVNPAENLRSE